MVRYLLGEATEAERTQVEERFLSDHDYFEQLLALEEALVDQYARGDLAVENRESFDKSSVSERRENVEFTRELIEDIRQKKLASKRAAWPSPFRVIFTRRYIVPTALAAATLVLLIAVPWILALRLEQRLTETRGELAASNRQAEADIEAERRMRINIQRQLDELPQSGRGNETDHLLSTRLKPYRGQRGGGGEMQVIEVSSRLQVVILNISLEKTGSHKSFQVRVTSSENPSPMTISGLTLERDGSTLRVPITASKLERGDYGLTVLAEQDNRDPVVIDNYSFRVKRTG